MPATPHSPSRPLLQTAEWRTRLCRARHVLVASDFDGTISEIVAEPSMAVPAAGAEAALNALSARSDFAVAVASGRGVDDLRARCHVRQCWYIGSHGNEWIAPAPADSAPPSAIEVVSRDEASRILAPVLQQVQQALPRWPGATVEIKPYSVAMHCRQAPRWEGSIAEFGNRMAKQFAVRVVHGRRVVELIVAIAETKASAVRKLRTESGCDLAFYLGDDTTDEDVFREADDGLIGIHVGEIIDGRYAGEDESDREGRITAAEFWLCGPSEVVRWLAELSSLRDTATHRQQHR